MEKSNIFRIWAIIRMNNYFFFRLLMFVCISYWTSNGRLFGLKKLSSFVSFQGLCEKLTKEAKANYISDVHAPGRFRCNGALENLEEFRNAFNCSPDSKMVSKSMCRIW